MKSRRIFVSGHKGLVGSALVRALEARGYTQIIAIPHSQLDLTHPHEVEKFFRSEKPQWVLHAAGLVGGIWANLRYPVEFFCDNILMGVNLLRAAHNHGVERLLNLGSSCIYPRSLEKPLKEEDLLTGPLEPTNEAYALAKIGVEKLCEYFRREYNRDYFTVMPCNLYGPGDNYNLETSHVLAALLRKFHLANLLENKDHSAIRNDLLAFPIGFGITEVPDDLDQARTILGKVGIYESRVILWGTGSPLREFLHVDDLADACVFLLEYPDRSRIPPLINVGSGEEISIRSLAFLIREIVGYKGEIHFDPEKPSGIFRKLLDSTRIRALGWAPRTGLKEGITKTYRDYQGRLQAQVVPG